MTSLGTGRQTLGGRYELVEPIASGGMGQVWRGRDVLLERPVAVKVLRSEYADDPVFLERFRCEARHAAALSHPNIAAVLDYGETSDADTGESLAYLVMELVEGAPLSALLSADGPLEPGAALSVLEQTAAGLAEAHRAGLVHRDVKPANILVRPDGGVKLTDFGIAWSAESVPLTGTGQVIGTARYMSPEQAAGGRVSPASDVYALGLVGYESLTGHAPFDGTNPVTVALKQVREQPEPLPEDVPPVVRSLIDAALVKDPAERPPDADAFLTAVQETIEGTAGATAVRTGPPTSPVPGLRPVGDGDDGGDDTAQASSRRSRALLLVPVLALVLAGLLAVVLWPSGSGGQAPAQAAETSAPSGGSAAAASSVVLTAGEHVGRPVEEVAADLTALGLTVARETEETTAVEPGTVAALDPVGVPLRAGDTVTLSVAVAPPAASPAGQAPAEETAPAGEQAPAPSDTAAPGDASGPAPAAPSGTTPSGPAPSQPAGSAAPLPGAGVSAPEDPAPEGSGAAPSEPVETGPAPSDPVPSDPVPSEPVPSEPVPSDPAPSDPVGPSPSEPEAPAPTSPGSSASSSAPSSGPSGPPSAVPSAPDAGAAG